MQSTRLHLASRCADYYVLNKDTSRVQYIDPGGLVRCTDAPPVRICNVYDICELAEAENRAGKASDGPEHGPGTCWPVALRKVLILKLAIVRARTEAQELARSCSWVEILFA